jgi:hypothetical protein
MEGIKGTAYGLEAVTRVNVYGRPTFLKQSIPKRLWSTRFGRTSKPLVTIGALQPMSTYSVKMEATEQERQLVEVVREHEVDATSDFRLLVQKQDGAWDVTLSIAPHDDLSTSRGTGATFNDAWDNMAPLWT